MRTDYVLKCLIAIVVAYVIAVVFTGCASPEGFNVEALECKELPGDTYIYDCEGGGSYRCLDTTGKVKYDDCIYRGAYCVANCFNHTDAQ